jgi:anti-sigma factor RsiW
MSCAEHDGDLALAVSDDLPTERAHGLQQHLVRCADCRARLEEYRADAAWLRSQRNGRTEASMAGQLRARLANEIAQQPPASWTVAWLRRLAEGVSRGPQPLLAALAVALLVVGAAGALTRPLRPSNRAPALDGDSVSSRASTRRATTASAAWDIDDHEGEELAQGDEVDEVDEEHGPSLDEPTTNLGATATEAPTGAAGSGTPAALDETAELAASKPGSMRIEMRTGDPDVRIIWFAQADRNDSELPERR